MNAVAAMKPAQQLGYITGFGQSDTHAVILSDGRQNPHKSSGAPYGTVTGQEIVEMVEAPPSVPKASAQWFIPSTYAAHDGRSHNAQRDNGTFHWLTLDVDENNLPIEAIREALSAVLGPCSYLVYATRSATAERRKWRALVRLQEPLGGADYQDTAAAFYDLLESHTQGELICDRPLQGTGQLVYLPNQGEFYDYHIERAGQLHLDERHPIIQRRDLDRRARAQAEIEANAARERKAAQRLATCGDAPDPATHFNQGNTIADLLERYGYARAGRSSDWRSPMQQSRTYATRDYGDHWLSLSGSDEAAQIGSATKGGHRFGDAFDLYVYFEHGGDFSEAVRTYAQEAGIDYASKAEAPFAGWDFPPAETGACGSIEASQAEKQMPANSPSNDASGPAKAWPAPDRKYLVQDIPPPPPLPLVEVFTPKAAEWIAGTAEGAGAPADYVVATLLSVVGATVGNSRWVSPWRGWAEPPLVWSMAVGNPSAGKSPAIDAVLAPLRRAERPIRQVAETEREDWAKREKLAKLAEADWEARVKSAMKKGLEPPEMPQEAMMGEPPHIPRLMVSDGTVERLGVIAQAQPKGLLQVRDELAGWLLTMESRNGGSDRAFWLEAYGGRSFSVERMGRAPLTIDRLAIGALGGIQPNRLSELLTKASDDGLLARFLPVWPGRVPVKQPDRYASDALADEAMARLVALQMPVDDGGELRPWFVNFDDDAQRLMNDWREACAGWEESAEGLLLSFIGKLPGMAARVSLVLSAIGFAFDGESDPGERQITAAQFGRACHYLETYALPMARRCYGAASVPKQERAARRLLSVIREEGWQTFTTRQAMRAERAALGSEATLNPAIRALEEGDIIRLTAVPPGPKGGRPVRAYEVNPAVLEDAS